MKKLTIVLTGLLLSLSACKKTYSCYCSQGIGGASYQKGGIHKGSKKNADSECESQTSDGEACYPVFEK